LQKTEDVCAEQGIHHLVSRVIAGNQRSLQFHFRCGYKMVGIQKEIGRLNGEWLDVAILQKILTDKQ
jgi:phosphinothricin acetyltransferase